MDDQQPRNSRKRARGQSHQATDTGDTQRAQKIHLDDPDQQHKHQALDRQVQHSHAPQHQPDPLPQHQHQQHVGVPHEHPTQTAQQLQQQPSLLQQQQLQATQAPLYPQGQRSAAAALQAHRDAWLLYQTECQSKGAMGLGELLDWKLLPLPRDHKPPDFETRVRRCYPDHVVCAPEYFDANFSAARGWAAGQQRHTYKAPPFENTLYMYPVTNEADVVEFFKEAAHCVQRVMTKELQRIDVYQPVSRRATPAEVVSFLSNADVVKPTPIALPAATTLPAAAAALASAAAASAAVAGSLPASVSAATSAAADAAIAAAACGARRSSRSSCVRPDLLLVERNPDSPPIPTIQGMQTLATWLIEFPEMRPQQVQSATLRHWQRVSKVNLRTPGNGKPVHIVEIKAPEKLVDAQGEPLRLDVLFKQFKDGVVTSESRSAHSILGQGFTYQVEFGVDVLILSTYAVSWAMERCPDSPGDLYISKPILASSHGPEPTLLLAILWAHLKGLQQLQEAPLQVLQPIVSSSQNHVVISHQSHHNNNDDSGEGDTAAHHRLPLQRKAKQLPQDSVYGSQLCASQQSNAVQQLDQGLGTSWQPSQLQPTQEQQQQQSLLQQSVMPELPLVHATSLGIHRGVEVLGDGESAVVFRGQLGSVESAIKVVFSLREVVREAGLYKHCQQLQGVVIPQMRGIGKLAPGTSGYGFLAVSIVDGVPLSTVCMSSSVRAAAISAVQALHGCGVVHGDLTMDNMMLLQQPPVSSSSSPSPQQARVMLLDLARARLATAEERALELQRLKQELRVVR